jgi:hypothetical protein
MPRFESGMLSFSGIVFAGNLLEPGGVSSAETRSMMTGLGRMRAFAASSFLKKRGDGLHFPREPRS